MINNNVFITTEEYVQEFKDLKDNLIRGYFTIDSDISRIHVLAESGMSNEQINLTKNIVSEVLTDALYTILLGLEGSASIAQYQIMYKLFDEASNELTGNIESIAWEKFHSENA